MFPPRTTVIIQESGPDQPSGLVPAWCGNDEKRDHSPSSGNDDLTAVARTRREQTGQVLEVLDHLGQMSGGRAESWCVGVGVVEALHCACRFDRDGEVLAIVPIDHLDEECV